MIFRKSKADAVRAIAPKTESNIITRNLYHCDFQSKIESTILTRTESIPNRTVFARDIVGLIYFESFQ